MGGPNSWLGQLMVGAVGFPLPGKGGAASGGGKGFSSWSPSALHPHGENINSSVGGWGRAGSPKPRGVPRYPHRARVGSGEERYSNTEATVNTTPRGRLGTGGNQIKVRCVCPGLPAPWGCGAGFGQLGESLWGSWRSGVGSGRGRAGGAGERGSQTDAVERTATRTTLSWK